MLNTYANVAKNMMIESSRTEKTTTTSIQADNFDWKKISLQLVTLVNKAQIFFQDSCHNIPTENGAVLSETSNPENISTGTTIYVCTFCQVFSSSNDAIREHIATLHSSSLPTGTKAEDFISKLQALKSENKKKCPKKVGRPRKILSESLPPSGEKLPITEPIPGPDGLYWCQKCMKYFKKSRQLSMHVCLELEDDDILSDSSMESDGSTEFQTYMDVEPTPWFKRPKISKPQKNLNLINKETSETSVVAEEQPNKITPHWREDPSYVPLFGNEKEKHAFEEHLKSIDYSCVDNLFIKEEKKVQGKRKKSCLNSSISVYSCILCKRVQNSLTHIRMHCLTHTEVKPFTCPKCPYRCNTKGSLYTHMRNHTGNVFRCSQCDFKCTKRAHLLDHEETHSGVSQLCQLCKNSYKTLKSLIAHVKRYHVNPGGKKFLKILTSKNYKETIIECNICTKKFMSQSSFDIHNRKEHSITVIPTETEVAVTNIENIQNTIPEEMQMDESSLVPSTVSTLDPLAEIVLNNLLQQKNTVPMELYEDVFPESSDSGMIAAPDSLNDSFVSNPSSQNMPPLNGPHQFHSSKDVLVECGKNLNLQIIDECLRNSEFAEEVISEACISPKLSNECHQTFDLPEISLDFANDSLVASDITKDNVNIHKDLSQINADDLVDKNCLNENKADEIKLFEKCRRAPAYVCCVCSGIFICPSTLKAHLKEHINTTSSLIEQAAQDFAQEKLTESDSDLDNVCRILQDPDTCSEDEKELEKLYSSSLDMIWYLPEVSVVLENDPALFDSVLDDISNFPIADKFDDSEDIVVKCPEIF